MRNSSLTFVIYQQRRTAARATRSVDAARSTPSDPLIDATGHRHSAHIHYWPGARTGFSPCHQRKRALNDEWNPMLHLRLSWATVQSGHQRSVGRTASSVSRASSTFSRMRSFSWVSEAWKCKANVVLMIWWEQKVVYRIIGIFYASFHRLTFLTCLVPGSVPKLWDVFVPSVCW